jgi:uncharacterized protein with HEPN domain
VREDSVYLHHILDCIQRIEEDTAGGYEFFLRSPTHQDAAMRNLQIMAESTQRLSDETKATHPEIPWQSIAAFRNALVHGYLRVDLNIVWDVIERDVPEVKQAALDMLALLQDRTSSDNK